jgi:hypothetical protein
MWNRLDNYRYQIFGEPVASIVLFRLEEIPAEHLYPSTKLHAVISQKSFLSATKNLVSHSCIINYWTFIKVA